MSQIKKKFIEDNAIDGVKLQLMNGQGLRTQNADGSDRTLFYFDNLNQWQFSVIPQLGSDPSLANDLVRKSYVDASVSTEASSRSAAVSAEQSRAQAAESTLSGRLDVVQGSVTTAGSIAKALADAEAYTDSKIADLVNGAPGLLDTLKELADALGDDPNFATSISNQIAGLSSSITALQNQSTGNLESEQSARMAADSALSGRLDVIEGADTVSGSVAKALKDAKAYTDSSVSSEQSARMSADSTEQSARMAADSALSGRLDVIEGADSVNGSVAKALKDAKAYADSQVMAEQSARESAVSAEESARMAAVSAEESARMAAISSEQSARIAAVSAEESARMAAVSAEESARMAADSTLQGNIDAEASARTAAIASEASARTAADTNLQNQINSLDGYTLDLRGDLDQEVTDRKAADSTEQSARMAADSALSGRLDIIEGADTVAGSVAKALKDAKAYTDSSVSAEESARIAAVSAEASLRAAAVSAEESARIAADSTEQSARMAADSALSGRLDVIEGTDTVSGSVAKSLKDAKAYADQKIADLVNGAPGVLDTLKELADALGDDPNFATTLSNELATIQTDITSLQNSSGANLSAEESARKAADSALSGRLDVIEGADTVSGSVAKALKDAKAYTDSSVSAEQSARMTAVSAEESARIAAVSSEQSARIAADNTLQGNLDAEASARIAAVSAEESARIAAYNSLDGRLDIIEGADTVNGSVAKSLKDAKAYTDTKFSAEQSARMAADSTLQGNLDAEQSARMSADSALSGRLDVIEGADSVNGSVAKALKDAKAYADSQVMAEQTARIAADGVLQSNIDTIDGRLDVLEGADSVSGSVAKALKDAKVYADSKVSAEQSARMSADNALSGRLDVIEGADTVAGSVAKALKDAKAYTDSSVSAEASSRSTADAALQSEIDAINAVVHEKEKFVLSSLDISNGYINLAHQAIEKSILVIVDRLVAHADDDYSVAVVSGVTRITLLNSFSSGGSEALAAGDVIHVMYRHS